MKIDISLTDFVDFAMKSGTPKVTKVSEMKDRPDYQPAFDFYKRFREALFEAHRGGEGISVITAMVRSQTDPKKRAQYEEIASAYKSWCGRKSLVWFEPPRDELRVGDVRMRLKPRARTHDPRRASRHQALLQAREAPAKPCGDDRVLDGKGARREGSGGRVQHPRRSPQEPHDPVERPQAPRNALGRRARCARSNVGSGVMAPRGTRTRA